MSKTVKAYAAYEKDAELHAFEYELQDPTTNQIQIKVEYCGVCHSDIHLIDDEWEMTKFPFVPGHEIIGVVEEIGENVKHFKKSDKIGVGWQSGSCGECKDCKSGYQNICTHMESTCVDAQGGFGEYVNINEEFVVHIPKGLDDAATAPMLCGGVTVYNPLEYYNIRPWMKVGVVGIGGLGHMAVQFAKAMGCEVTAFSTSPNKEKEAREFGADKFITDINDKSIENYYDFIIVTTPAKLDWDRFMVMLRGRGKLCFVGALSEPITVDFFNLMECQKEVVAGSIGSPAMIDQMLDFSARHKIGAQVEIFDLNDVNKAVEKVRNGSIRYRAVLKI